MTVRFAKRQILLLLFSLILIGAFFAVLYLYKLKPLYSRIDELNATVSNEKKLLAALQAQASKQQTDVTDSIVELQKKVPVKPLVEQLILDLEKAEVVSNSFISSMAFNENAEINAPPQATNQTIGQGVEAQLNTNSQPVQPSSPQQQNNSSLALPDGLKKITVQLTVQSPSYYHLERFLQTLEGLDRIVSVEALSFTGNPELTSADATVKPLTYSLTVSAFYYPGLVNLQNKVPPLDVPPPSEKRNPLTELIPDEPKDGEQSPQR
ncbi:type IV pilus assembly protein PilO [Anoxybacillus tepidamans]|uniref:Type IV pilus assembly protein PilO n=1 Tax=Anoxybacteroides tepidamans TaxID=265948 RepID=A0A7W8IRH2_9BACL|nr:pilus assembly protein PilO [Anoxybacillus tepidamans]MBB5324571.1 type IV pilus assembly protein PilO [Anoxybacillus tepidamans]